MLKEDLAENDYIDFAAGAEAAYEGCGGYKLFSGTLSFYAAEGMVLNPNVKTNVGEIGTGLADSSREIIVKAKEDTVVSIEYAPAYL